MRLRSINGHAYPLSPLLSIGPGTAAGKWWGDATKILLVSGWFYSGKERQIRKEIRKFKAATNSNNFALSKGGGEGGETKVKVYISILTASLNVSRRFYDNFDANSEPGKFLAATRVYRGNRSGNRPSSAANVSTKVERAYVIKYSCDKERI